MRRILALAVFGCLFAGAGRAPASEKDDALAILDKAIKAHGGVDALAKAAQLKRKSTGKMTFSQAVAGP